MPRRYRFLNRTVAEFRRPHRWPLSRFRAAPVRSAVPRSCPTARRGLSRPDPPPRAAAASRWKRGRGLLRGAREGSAASSRCTKNKPHALSSHRRAVRRAVGLLERRERETAPRTGIPSAFASQTNPSSTAGVITNDGSCWLNAKLSPPVICNSWIASASAGDTTTRSGL